VLKLLKAGVIYPVSDNEWVSLVQVVLKKGRMTVIRNENNELICHTPVPRTELKSPYVSRMFKSHVRLTIW
jgi:hypothetical protein